MARLRLLKRLRRIESAEKVVQEKDKISQSKGTLANKRNKLLNFIKALGSCQEYKPLLGKLVDRAFAHNSNNAWAYFHG